MLEFHSVVEAVYCNDMWSDSFQNIVSVTLIQFYNVHVMFVANKFKTFVLSEKSLEFRRQWHVEKHIARKKYKENKIQLGNIKFCDRNDNKN